MKRTFLFVTIASILSINAYAVSATVTSKDYVDTTRQATIPASGTNSATPGDTVVTYTDTAGTIGERGIFDDWSVGIVENSLQDNLVTAGVLLDATDEIWDEMNELQYSVAEISSTVDNLPETTVTYKTCYEYSNGDCILWNLSEKTVYGGCTADSQCVSYCAGLGIPYDGVSCNNGGCECFINEQ